MEPLSMLLFKLNLNELFFAVSLQNEVYPYGAPFNATIQIKPKSIHFFSITTE